MKKQRRGLNRYNVLHDRWRSLVCQTNRLFVHLLFSYHLTVSCLFANLVILISMAIVWFCLHQFLVIAYIFILVNRLDVYQKVSLDSGKTEEAKA